MKIVCIQHVDFETPGVIEGWAQKNGHAFQVVKGYKGDPFPQAENFDFVISMGGPQSPLDARDITYLQQEVHFLKEAVEQNKYVLGFCLGAQLIGESLGAKTKKSPEKEIGVFPIELTEAGHRDPLFRDFPSSFPVIHWHNDMPGATENSLLLAKSKGCPIQAYRYAPRAYGLQFHMEITKEGIENLISNVPDDLKPSRYTQSQEQLLEQDYESIHKNMYIVLDRLIRL